MEFIPQNGKWLPPPEDIINLYEALDRQENIELEWQCPGRRPPTPTKTAQLKQSFDDNMNEE